MKQTNKIKRVKITFLLIIALLLAMSFAFSSNKTEATSSVVVGHETENPEQQEAQQPKKGNMNPRSLGCVVCHTGSESMHADGDDELDIGCADCHGGDPKETQDKIKAHVQPKYLKTGTDTANIERLAALWNKESDEYIRFVNPG